MMDAWYWVAFLLGFTLVIGATVVFTYWYDEREQRKVDERIQKALRDGHNEMREVRSK